MSSSVFKEGWCTKQGGMIKTWHRRWFTLCDYQLRYSRTPGVKEQGSIAITKDCSFELAPECKKSNAFKVIVPGVRTYFIVPDTLQEAIDWVAALNEAKNELLAPAVKSVSLDTIKEVGIIGSSDHGCVIRYSLDEKSFAVKVFPKAKIPDIEEYIKAKESLIDLKGSLFIAPLIHIFENQSQVFLLSQYVPGSSLAMYIARVPERCIAQFAGEMMIGVNAFHSKDFIIGDLHPSNFIVDTDSHIALTDQGIRGQVTEYSAPEIVKGEPPCKASDYWSLGIIIYEMIYGVTPFYNTNPEIMKRNILESEVVFSDDSHQLAQELIQDLLKKDPSERLSAFDSYMGYGLFSRLSFESSESDRTFPPQKEHPAQIPITLDPNSSLFSDK